MKFSKSSTLIIIFFTVFLNSLGISVIIPVVAMLFLDPLHQVLGAAYTLPQTMLIIGLLKAAYPVFQFIGAPLLGSISDRIGRRPVLLFSLQGSIIGYCLFIYGIIFQNLTLLFAGRMIDGLTGGNVSVVYSAIADLSNSSEKPKRFGLVGMAFGFGFIAGPLLGGITSDPGIVSWFNYATPFFVAVILVLINALIVLFMFPETNMQKVTGKRIFSSGFKEFIKAFEMIKTHKLLLVAFLFILSFTFYTQFFDVYLISEFGFNQRNIGNIFAYIGIWIVISQGLVTHWLSLKFHSSHLLRLSLLLLSFFLFLLIIPKESWWFAILLPFVSIFHGLSQPNLLSLISDNCPGHLQGKILGINQSLQSIAYALPPIIAGIIIIWNVNLPIIVSSVFMLFAWIMFLFISRKQQDN